MSAGRVATVEHRSLDTLRFATVVADTSDSERFDDVLSAARSALMKAAEEAEGRMLVARLVLEGVGGAACTLAVPPWERKAALGAVTRELCDGSVWLDETWVDTGIGSWLLDAAA